MKKSIIFFSTPHSHLPTLFLLLFFFTTVPTKSFAVDRSKFRTCGQTSFCRRHRNGHSERLYKYKLVESSVVFLDVDSSPSKEKEEKNNEEMEEEERKLEQEGGKERGLWSRLSRALSGTSHTDPKHEDAVGHFNDGNARGPEPIFSALLHNTASETSTTEDEYLDLSIALHGDGIARIRIKELSPDVEYKGVDEGYHKRYSPRWTSDGLILNLEEMMPASSVAFSSKEKNADLIKSLVGKLATEDKNVENYLVLSYNQKNDLSSEEEESKVYLLLQIDPFAFYMFREKETGGEIVGPIVSVGTQQLMHFEIRRSKPSEDDSEEEQEVAEETDAAPADEEEKEETDKHGGKEIVGYWEDGLAIYADGTREERPVEDEEELHHRQLLEEQAPELDKEGMWEETFGQFKDTKPHGPTSVGMDIIFDTSQHLYGLPEHASSLKLQRTHGEGAKYHDPYRLYNLDVFEYELDETMALYGEVPLIVSQSEEMGSVGVFWFNPTETFVDVEEVAVAKDGDTKKELRTHWMSESGVIDIFLLPGPNPQTLYSQYAHLTGRMPLPPMFSLGYHQCRWNYKDERDVYQVHSKFEEYDYPYDVLWLDIEHTDGKRYFTWDKNLFPHPKEMQEKLSSQGRRMVTIVDPHIKRDNNYYVHKQATAEGLYIKDNTGKKDFDGWCWPGSSSYLDFTSEHVRNWWASQFAYDKYQGSTPSLYTWNDMNEPSVFNGPEVSMQKDLLNLQGVEHREWHNLYGLLFQRATAEGLVKRNAPDYNDRPFVLTRSFFASSQKYGAIWTGDNESKWSHLAIAAPMLLSMNVAALSFVGADVGGFFGNPDAELMTRWMQAGAYQPFFRGHAHHDAKRREPWMFGDETLERLRKSAMARYALLPYWYTVFREAGVTGMPVMRAMWMQYPQVSELYDTDDQYLIGSDLLVKPVTDPGVTQSNVIFPTADIWYDVDTMKQMTTSSVKVISLSVKSDIDKIPVYQRGGSILPRKLRLRRSTRLMIHDPYTLYIALDKNLRASGSLYMDDEHTFDHDRHGIYATANFEMKVDDIESTIRNVVELGPGLVTEDGGTPTSLDESMKSSSRMIERIVVMGMPRTPMEVHVPSDTKSSLEFEYGSSSKVLVIRKPNLSALDNWDIGVVF